LEDKAIFTHFYHWTSTHCADLVHEPSESLDITFPFIAKKERLNKEQCCCKHELDKSSWFSKET
jgi:hypothetical protein